MFTYTYICIEVSLFDPNNREPVPGVVPKTFIIKVSKMLLYMYMLDIACAFMHTYVYIYTRVGQYTRNTVYQRHQPVPVWLISNTEIPCVLLIKFFVARGGQEAIM